MPLEAWQAPEPVVRLALDLVDDTALAFDDTSEPSADLVPATYTCTVVIDPWLGEEEARSAPRSPRLSRSRQMSPRSALSTSTRMTAS